MTGSCRSARFFRLIKLFEQFKRQLWIATPSQCFKPHPRIKVGKRHSRQFINQFIDADRMGTRERFESFVFVTRQSDAEFRRGNLRELFDSRAGVVRLASAGKSVTHFLLMPYRQNHDDI